MTSSLRHIGTVLGLSQHNVDVYVNRMFSDRDAPTTRELYDVIETKIRHTASSVNMRSYKLPYCLDNDLSVRLYSLFPEFDINIVGQRRTNYLCDFYRSIKFLLKVSVLETVKKAKLVDYSGEFRDSLLYTNKDNVVYCSLLNYSKHQVYFEDQMRDLLRIFKSEFVLSDIYDRINMAKFMSSINRDNSRIYINSVDDKLGARYAYYDHVNFDIPIEQVATVAIKNGYMVSYGLFMFDLDMLLPGATTGQFKQTKIKYVIDGDNVKFVTHDDMTEKVLNFGNIKKMAQYNVISVGDYRFSIELFKRKGEFFVYKMINLGKCKPSGKKMSHAIWDVDIGKRKLIRSYAVRSKYLDAKDKCSYRYHYVSVPVEIYTKAKEHADGLDVNELSFEEIQNYVEVISMKQIIHGVDYVRDNMINSDEQLHLSLSIFDSSFATRYDQTQVVNFLKMNMITRSKLAEKWYFLKRFRAYLYNYLDVIKNMTYSNLVEWVCKKIIVEHNNLLLKPVISDKRVFESFTDIIDDNLVNKYDFNVYSRFNSKLGFGQLYNNIIKHTAKVDNVDNDDNFVNNVFASKSHSCKMKCMAAFEDANAVSCTFSSEHYEFCCKVRDVDAKVCQSFYNCNYCCCKFNVAVSSDSIEQPIIIENKRPSNIIGTVVSNSLIKTLDKLFKTPNLPSFIVVLNDLLKVKIQQYLLDKGITDKVVAVFPDVRCLGKDAVYIGTKFGWSDRDNDAINRIYTTISSHRKYTVDVGDMFQTNLLTQAALDVYKKINNENVMLNASETRLLTVNELFSSAVHVGFNSVNVRPPELVNPIAFCRDTVNQIFPGVADENKSYDIGLSEVADTTFSIETIQFEISRSKADMPPVRKYFPSKIRTGQTANKIQRQKTLLHSLKTRNLNVANLAEPQHKETVVADTLQCILDKFCHPAAKDLLEYYNSRKIQLNKDNLSDWLMVQTPEKLQYLVKTERSLCAYAADMQRKNLMVKSAGKVDTSGSNYHTIKASQTVVYHDREINACWSPLFLELRSRFMSLLKPNVLVNMKKDRNQIEEFLNVYDDPFKQYNYIENDFDTYDKSQQEIALSVEWAVYLALGMDPLDYEIWKYSNQLSKIRSISTGITIYLSPMRFSGLATTALGNTIVNVGALAKGYYKITYFVFAMVLGDDSLICVLVIIDCGDVCHIIASVFNLSAKTIQSPYGYFCSCFIVKTINGIKFMSDPIKRYEKLGTHTATDESKIFDMYQSYCDLMANYNDIGALEQLAIAVQYRYDLCDINVLPLLISLYNFTVSYKVYRNIYEKEMVIIEI